MRSERHSSASATVVKANGRNQEWPKCPVRRLPYAELDNLYTYVPPRIAIRNARRFGDLELFEPKTICSFMAAQASRSRHCRAGGPILDPLILPGSRSGGLTPRRCPECKLA